MIHRLAQTTLQTLAQGFPIVALTGPRHSGKTTLARKVFSRHAYATLEDPEVREHATTDPRGFLARFPKGAILDEAQRCPGLFSYLQDVVDERRRMGEFILTGSHQFGLLSGIAQSLAGRVGLVQLLPLTVAELMKAGQLPASVDDMLLRGGYPALHDRPILPAHWFANYATTYLERDVRQLLAVRDLSLFQRFVRLCAARTGQLLNLSSLAADCGISHVTAREWLTVLEASYIVFLLPPYHRNFGKRLVKTPKLYFLDAAFAAWLMGIRDAESLNIHAQRGALFETMVVGEFIKHRYNLGLPADLYFWRDNTGHEVDLLFEQAGMLQAVEIKSGSTFVADWMKAARKWQSFAGDEALPPCIIYGGEQSYQREGLEVIAWRALDSVMEGRA